MEICHYTKYETVFKILESKQLWATNFQFLNDRSEIIHAKKILFENLMSLYEECSDNYDEVKKNIEILYEALNNEIYIVSFCKYRTDIPNSGSLPQPDDLGLLSMWRSYGSEGGCGIVFNESKLDDAWFPKKENCESDERYDKCRVFEAVQYDGLRVENNSFKRSLNNLRDYCNSVFHKRDKSSLENGEILKNLLHVIPFFKHSGFHEEKEYRLVVVRDVSNKGGQVVKPCPVFYCDNGTPYVKVDYGIETIEKVVVGPGQEQHDKVNKLGHFINNRAELKHIKVVPSSIPFVG